MGVPSKYRRQGFATEMLHMVEDLSLTRGGIKELHLNSVSSAVPVYEKFGFEKKISEHFENNVFDNLLFPMYKKIKL